SAGDEALSGVTVEVADLPAAIEVERFVVHEVDMARRSGGRDPRVSLGWRKEAVPPAPEEGARIADPLIPADCAPAWADYPMSVPRRAQRIVWMDLALGDAATAERHHGRIVIRDAAHRVTELPVEIEVEAAELPFRAVKTMVYSELEDVVERVGSRR